MVAGALSSPAVSTRDYTRYREALAHRSLPAAFVDLDRFDENAASMERRAGGMPIRVASKSVRCVALLRRVLARPGWKGVLAYSMAEAAQLVRSGFDDVLVAYPTVDDGSLRAVAPALREGRQVIAMVDDVAHVRRIAEVAQREGVTFPLCLDVDVGSAFPGLFFGVRRSPVRSVADARRVADLIGRTAGVELVGVMGYEAQIAGLPDATEKRAMDLAVRALKRVSFADVARRRGAIVEALRADGHPLRLVNGGGTGSLEVTRTDASVTELAAGSGLFAPTTFDAFASFRNAPAAGFALPVTRLPAPGYATCFGGGYVASGSPGWPKVPKPWLPEGLALLDDEAVGEVQTPLRVPRDVKLAIGAPVFFRHAKAGELCERFETLALVRGDVVVDEVPTYRGQRWCFG